MTGRSNWLRTAAGWLLAGGVAALLAGACNGSSGGSGDEMCGGEDMGGVDCMCGDEEMFAPDCIDGQIVCADCAEDHPVPCGPGVGTGCPGGQFCFFEDGQCGAGAATGACVDARSDDECDTSQIAACGCDGALHPSDCAVNAAGLDVSLRGDCALADQQFRCGAEICHAGTDVCWHDESSEEPAEHDLGASCYAPSCALDDCNCILMEIFGDLTPDCWTAPDGSTHVSW